MSGKLVCSCVSGRVHDLGNGQLEWATDSTWRLLYSWALLTHKSHSPLRFGWRVTALFLMETSYYDSSPQLPHSGRSQSMASLIACSPLSDLTASHPCYSHLTTGTWALNCSLKSRGGESLGQRPGPLLSHTDCMVLSLLRADGGYLEGKLGSHSWALSDEKNLDPKFRF